MANNSGDSIRGIARFFQVTRPQRQPEDVSVEADEADAVTTPPEALRGTGVPAADAATIPAVNLLPNDIGRVMEDGLDRMTDIQKMFILHNRWNPPTGFMFPLQHYPTQHQRRSFQRRWLQQFQWLHYSLKYHGAFCAPCALFSHGTGGRGGQVLRTLVTEPFQRYKKALEIFRSHDGAEFHKMCVERACLFQRNYENPASNVQNQMEQGRQKTIAENRRKLIPIVKTIIFCGKNNLPLRGHHDDGPVTPTSDKSTDDGLFRSLLRFRLDSGDEDLKNTLDGAASNATYTSKTTQNDIIECIQEAITTELSKQVTEAGIFSIMMDETTDAGKVEQASIVIRFVDIQGHIHEAFFAFVEAQNVTGRGLADLILNFLNSVGLSMDQCRGQGYDGAAAMQGQFNGCQAHLRQVQSLAVYIHCFNHRLNLAISHSCDTKDMKNMFGILSKVCKFLMGSAQRVAKLEELLSVEGGNPAKRRRLKVLCPTRWVERHDAIIIFTEMFPFVMQALAFYMEHGNQTASADAVCLFRSCQTPQFLAAVHVANHCLAQSVGVSKALQDPSAVLSTAYTRINDVTDEFRKMRENSEEEFHEIFEEISSVAQDVGIEIGIPRLAGRQIHRNNVQVETPEEYYRISIFVPFLDHLITQLSDCFQAQYPVQLQLQELLPQYVSVEESTDRIMQAAILYEDDLQQSMVVVKAQVQSWINYISQLENQNEDHFDKDKHTKPVPLSHWVKLAQDQFLPTVAMLLRIFGTIPVSNATTERTFSKLKLLKTYLRTTMGQERLSGLALMSIHQDMKVKPEKAINIFAYKKNRWILLK